MNFSNILIQYTIQIKWETLGKRLFLLLNWVRGHNSTHEYGSITVSGFLQMRIKIVGQSDCDLDEIIIYYIFNVTSSLQNYQNSLALNYILKNGFFFKKKLEHLSDETN